MSKKVINKIPLAILHEAQLRLDEVITMLGPYRAEGPPQQAAVRLGPEFFEFVEFSCGLVIENPGLLPVFPEAASMGEEFSVVRELWNFDNKINQLKNYMYDIEMNAGGHVLETALAFYQMVKIAARHDLPGARLIYEELKPRRTCVRRKPHQTRGTQAS